MATVPASLHFVVCLQTELQDTDSNPETPDVTVCTVQGLADVPSLVPPLSLEQGVELFGVIACVWLSVAALFPIQDAVAES